MMRNPKQWKININTLRDVPGGYRLLEWNKEGHVILVLNYGPLNIARLNSRPWLLGNLVIFVLVLFSQLPTKLLPSPSMTE